MVSNNVPVPSSVPAIMFSSSLFNPLLLPAVTLEPNLTQLALFILSQRQSNFSIYRRKTDADFSVESISLKTSCCFNAEKSLEAYAVRSNFHKISHYIYNNDQQSCIILQVAKSGISCSTKFFIKCWQQAYFTGRNRQRKCDKVIKWMEAHERS